MKRLKNIYSLVYDTDNLLRSQHNAQRGKQDRNEVKQFNKETTSNLFKLYDMLESESYQASEYRIKIIYEPKERVIMIAPFFPDRIIHHCVINVLGEMWTKIFINNTYACVKGRGIHKCMGDIHRALINDNKGTKYCLKIDIVKFYDNVNHNVLKSIIRYRIADEKMLRLLDKIIDSNHQPKGLPIGNFTSQYLANLYLSYFDHFAKEELKIKYYYRYMDDMVILNDSKETLRYYLDMMGLYLGAELHLEIKHNWQIFPVDARGIDYVGFKQNHFGILLRKGILSRFYKKFNSVARKHDISDMTDIKHLFASEYGWIIKCSEEHSNYIFNKCLNNGRCIKNRAVSGQ
ncbi:MAG: reverse transcriptase/maturase family protein [Prevotellaceae bacterium]|jgi:retron-type reverse transcriptase|nr:reverse transcriptase/maturase family protein [Prevotellaceae bacterium]